MYFSNSDGHFWLERQCAGCVHHNEDEACPVEAIHLLYNYDQYNVGQEMLRESMTMLMDKDGCKMRHETQDPDHA